MKLRDLIYIIMPLVRGILLGLGAVACAAVIPLMFALAVAIAG